MHTELISIKKFYEIIVTIFLLIHAIHPWIIVLYRGRCNYRTHN